MYRNDKGFTTPRLIAVMTSEVRAMWGKRCPDYEPECCVCRAWDMRDKRATRLWKGEPVAVARWSNKAARV